MLLHIPQIFTADFLKLIMELGHGEELLICDANFPYKTYRKDTVHLSGCRVAEVLRETLHFFPLDRTVEYAAVCMEAARENGLFERYEQILAAEAVPVRLEAVPRFAFYDRAAGAAGVAVTSDTARGANIIIKKGVVSGENTNENGN